MTTRTRHRRISTWLVAAALLPTLSGAAPPGVEAFGKIPGMANVRINPRGDLLARIDNAGTEQRAVIFDLTTGREKRAIGMGAVTKLRNLRWADDETLLMHASVTFKIPGASDRYRDQAEMFRVFAADAAGGKDRMLLMEGARSLVTASTLHAWHLPKPKTVIMSTLDLALTSRSGNLDTRLGNERRDSGWVDSLYEVDTGNGEGRMIERGTAYTSDWVVDRNGAAAARSEWDSEHKIYRILAKDGGGWKEIYTQNDGETLGLNGLDAAGTAIIAMGARGSSAMKVWSIPLDGSAVTLLFEDPSGLDVTDIELDPATRVPVGAWVGGTNGELHWFDAKAKARANALLRSFPGKRVVLHGASESGRRLVVRVEPPASPGTYYLIDFDRKTADIVGEDYPGLIDVPLGEMRSLTYAARDGAQIPAYLTLPAGTEAKDLPLVVMPHGGPESRDEYAFDWWARFLASRGYAVLQPQFRGSTGFGEAHRMAGYRQWGRRMQDDVSDGVRSMIAQGIADPGRVCIVGASYGGYSALAGAAFTPDLYACAASINGVSDLPNMLGFVAHRGGRDSDSLSYWEDHIGLATDPEVIARSPARAADAIKAPILLIHGESDTVVPVQQARTMKTALERAGKSVQFVQLTGEDHWLSRSETRLRVLTELEAFLAKNLAPATRQ